MRWYSVKEIKLCDKELYIKSIISVVKNDWPMQLIKSRGRERVYSKTDLFIYISGGRAVYEFGNSKNEVSSGDIVYVSKDSGYIRNVESGDFSTIYVNFNFDTDYNERPACGVYKNVLNADINFKKLYRKWYQNESLRISSSMSILYSIYASLIDSERLSYIPGCKQKLFEEAVKKIQKNYNTQDFSVSQLVKESGMSEVHFRRLFKKIYKVSPQEYITNFKISRAKELLRYSELTVREVSDFLNFSDPCYFSRIFKKKTDYTPTEYRSTDL